MVRSTGSTTYGNSIIGQIVYNLDMKDNQADRKITKNAWDDFWKQNDKYGKFRGKKEVDVGEDGISVDKARKIIMTRMFNARNVSKNKSVNDIGIGWLQSMNDATAVDKSQTNTAVCSSETGEQKQNTNISDVFEQLKKQGEIIAQSIADSLNISNVQKPPSADTKKTNIVSNVRGIDNSYSTLSQEAAKQKAATDPRLEYLGEGEGWKVEDSLFRTDIRYARKNTGKILSYVASIIGESLTITSALGTKGSSKGSTPHVIRSRRDPYCSHHNAENPKLDLATNGHAYELQTKLLATGFFSQVAVEWKHPHLDIQIKPQVYEACERGNSMEKIYAHARSNTLDRLLA